jgi:hypothetical protein
VIEDWGLLTPFVIADAVVDVAGPPSGSSAITATLLLLLESVLELLQKELILLDLGLKLTELLQVQASKLSEGEALIPRCRWDNA